MIIVTIDLHGYSCDEARLKLAVALNSAFNYGERVVRIIHGQGKHSEVFPILRSMVRHWLETSDFIRTNVESIYRGEDGSPYTPPNPGETVVVFKDPLSRNLEPQLDYEEEERREARANSKKLRAERLRIVRRRR